MQTFNSEELSDRELTDLLAAWTIPDPPPTLRARIFNTPPAPAFELPGSASEPWYRLYRTRQNRSMGAALLLQVAAVGLLSLTVTSRLSKNVSKDRGDAIHLTFYNPKIAAGQKAGGGGGGGQLAPNSIAKGAAPKFSPRPFIPPAVAVPAPRLSVVPAITAPAPQIDSPIYGDPLSKLMDASAGQGVNGLGNGNGGGLGDSRGNGYGPGTDGGSDGGVYQIGGAVSAPILVSKTEPEYSEMARKAKFQGTVVLSVVVDEHGVPRDIHIVRPLGLGLDEKAVEALRRWRFRPGLKNGKPVSVLASVEVSFRLL